jgi:hypothetical protein
MEYYSFPLKRNAAIVAIWINLEDIMLNEISQAQKDNYYVFSLTYRILKGQTLSLKKHCIFLTKC